MNILFSGLMRYRKLKGDQIFTGYELLDENKVLVLDENGVVETIVPVQDAGEDIEILDGILMPGLINCHCHIELSHLKNIIPPHTGLVDFLIGVVKNRTIDEEQIRESIIASEKEMDENGIVGIGDICNTAHAIAVKEKSSLYWHNMIEVINMYDENLQKQLIHYGNIVAAYQKIEARSLFTPHAPYTVSAATYKAINEATPGGIISIHNQETAAENELFQKGTGEFLKLYAQFGTGTSPFDISRKTSLQTYLPHFTNGQTILLVHNTFITEEDIIFAKQHAQKHHLNIVYCLCPNANLYIENKLPPLELLLKHNCTIVLGTDSYSSNWSLSIASEIKTIWQHFPKLPLATVLQWATSNGAAAMSWETLGSFEKGKKPGVCVLNIKYENEKLSDITSGKTISA